MNAEQMLRASAAESIGIRSSVDGDEERVKKPKSRLKYIIHIAVMSITIASIIVQGVAMAVERSALMYVAGIIALLLAAVVCARQVLMAKTDTLREVHNKLREEVNRLTGENNELHNNVDELQTDVVKVQDIEKQLSQIAEADGTNVNHLVDLVKTNATTTRKQADCLKGSVAEAVLTSVLRTDRDSDLKITDREVDILVRRLKHQDGIKIEEKDLRDSLCKGDGSIGNLMNFFRKIMDETADNEANQALTLDMESFCKSYRR